MENSALFVCRLSKFLIDVYYDFEILGTVERRIAKIPEQGIAGVLIPETATTEHEKQHEYNIYLNNHL